MGRVRARLSTLGGRAQLVLGWLLWAVLVALLWVITDLGHTVVLGAAAALAVALVVTLAVSAIRHR